MIYLVEDDNSIRELVIYTLQTTGFEAKGFACAKDFWNEDEKGGAVSGASRHYAAG